MFKRIATATLLAGALIATAGGAALTNVSHSAAATRPAAVAAATHRQRPTRPARRHRLVLRVTAVNDDAINAVARNAQPYTVTVSMSTTYKEVGATAPSLADVHTGSFIVARGPRTGYHTIAARVVRIVLTRVAGVVTAVDGSTLTVTTRNAGSRTVIISNSTVYRRAGQPVAASDVTLAPGAIIVARGILAGDGSLNAVGIAIRPQHLAGRITAVNGSSYTITRPFGVTYTVVTSPSTTYVTRGGKTTSAAMTVGTRINAQGALSQDGTTLNALRVRIVRVSS